MDVGMMDGQKENDSSAPCWLQGHSAKLHPITNLPVCSQLFLSLTTSNQNISLPSDWALSK